MNILTNAGMGLRAGLVCLGLLSGLVLADEGAARVTGSSEKATADGVEQPGHQQIAPTAPSVTPAASKLNEYQIGAHDLIEISVFQVPDLSRTVRVNSRGLISLPLLGPVQAGGLTAQELEMSIAKMLSQNLLQDPQVSVFIKEFVSQRVVVEGSVTKAGVYPLTGRTTLLQVIALASGVDLVANENAVKVFRQSKDGADEKRDVLIYDLEAIRSGRTEDPLIQGNDLVVVEKSAGRSALKSVTDTLRGFFSFGRF